METEDMIILPVLSASETQPENHDGEDYNCKPRLNPLLGEAKAMEEASNGGISENGVSGIIEGHQLCLAKNDGKGSENDENGCLIVPEEIKIGNANAGQQNPNIDPSTVSSAKRPRTALGKEQPSVHIIYNALTIERKQKLEELLQQWSQWCADHNPSLHDSEEVLESGEDTYFPALRVGVDKPSAVSFWMDLPRKKKNKVLIPLDANSVPIYDRGITFALSKSDSSTNLEGAVEEVGASRCFNCSSYSHSMKDCKKPHDTVAISIARKQHRSKRNLNAASRNSIRYYQTSQKGKYDGLSPGVLDPETRKLLGLGELDPPPWLHRMHEIGSPPGYREEDNLSSGITIFGDDEIKKETGRGNLEKSVEPPKKMSVEFPGTNAPIPDGVDERHWGIWSSSAIGSRACHYIRRNGLTSYATEMGHSLEQQRMRCSAMEMNFEGDVPPPHQFRSFEDVGHPIASFRDFEEVEPPLYRFRSFEDVGPPPRLAFGRDFEAEGRYPRPWFSNFAEEEAPRHCWFQGFEGEGDPRHQFEFSDEWLVGPDNSSFSYRYRDYYYDSNFRATDSFRRSPLSRDHTFFSGYYPRH